MARGLVLGVLTRNMSSPNNFVQALTNLTSKANIVEVVGFVQRPMHISFSYYWYKIVMVSNTTTFFVFFRILINK